MSNLLNNDPQNNDLRSGKFAFGATVIYLALFQVAAVIGFTLLGGTHNEKALDSGLPYFAGLAIGLLFLFAIMPRKVRKSLFAPGVKKPSVRVIITCITLVLTVQVLLGVYDGILEWVLNKFGLSATNQLDSATGTATTVSMFLYACFLGPIAEEVVFRGFLLRRLEPLGQKTAIIGSAVMFGLFHVNLVQIPFAFGIGLILGFVAQEYGLRWAIALHIFNNFVLGEVLDWLFAPLPATVSDELNSMVILVGGVVGVILLFMARQPVLNWLGRHRYENPTLKKLLVSVPIILIAIALIGLAFLELGKA